MGIAIGCPSSACAVRQLSKTTAPCDSSVPSPFNKPFWVSVTAIPPSSSHNRPLYAKSPHSPIPISIILPGLFPTDQKPLLDARPQASATDDVHEVDLLVPVDADGEEVRVEAQRVAGVDDVLAAEAQAGREEVGFCVEVGEERVRGWEWGAMRGDE